MKRILIIEDEMHLRETTFTILEMSGYDVHVAADGKAGFEAILQLKPDLVVCDVHMPIMNGFEVLKAIKELIEPNSQPAFLFLTAQVQFEHIAEGFSLGADDYISKPFNVTYLLESIRLRLENKKLP